MKYAPTLATVFALVLAACASTEEAAQDPAADAPAGSASADALARRAPRERARPAARADARDASPLGLAPDAREVKTVQLYAGRDERASPILTLGGAETLTLAFDLVEANGRPLSVYYLHADRAWRRDLFPAQYVRGFERDDLVRYEHSRGTRVPYVHYAHEFPGGNTTFTLSGNYVARVTELGQQDAVLFERPFFVAEAATGADVGLDNQLLGGIGATVQPVIRLSTGGLDPGGFGYTACFARDGRYDLARCTERPYRTEPGALTFVLPPEGAFRPDAATYYVDLADLRPTNRLARVDVGASPPTVALAPDDAVFPEVVAASLNGQPVVRDGARTAGDPSVSAEYAEVTFALVPPNEVAFRDAFLEGSFAGWIPRAVRMPWVPERRRHEATVLVKQGRYEYRYTSTDPRLASAQSSALGRPDARYTAFVYYRDLRAQTDRLVAARSVRTQP